VLTLLLACKPDPTPETPAAAETTWIQDILVEPAELIPSALVVSFTTAAPGRAWVEFGLESPDERTTPISTEGTEHTWPIIGLPPLSDVVLRVVAEIDGEEYVSGEFTATSGQLLPDSPTMTVTVSDYEVSPETTLLLSVFGKPCHTAMASLDGTVFWALQQGDGDFAGVTVVPEPGQLAFSTYPLNIDEPGALTRVDLTGSEQSQLTTPEGHHFFATSPAGETWWLAVDERQIDGSQVRGDVVMRQTSESTSEPMFSFWDDFTPPTDATSAIVDWTHANWLVWSETRQTLTLSTAHTNHIIELSADGTMERIIGGPGAEGAQYTYLNPLDAFRRPHGVHWTDNGELLVFATMEDVSRVMRYRLDEETGTIETVWSFGTEYGYKTAVLGEAKELSDGNILISWGSTGLLQIVSPEGVVLWEAEAPFGSFFSQVHLLETPYEAVGG
jgi:hypothetical protein